jgi:hypothetical protein
VAGGGRMCAQSTSPSPGHQPPEGLRSRFCTPTAGSRPECLGAYRVRFGAVDLSPNEVRVIGELSANRKRLAGPGIRDLIPRRLRHPRIGSRSARFWRQCTPRRALRGGLQGASGRWTGCGGRFGGECGGQRRRLGGVGADFRLSAPWDGRRWVRGVGPTTRTPARSACGPARAVVDRHTSRDARGSPERWDHR